MNDKERANWVLVRDALLKAGNTNSEYYRRAAAIAEGKPDPLK